MKTNVRRRWWRPAAALSLSAVLVSGCAGMHTPFSSFGGGFPGTAKPEKAQSDTVWTGPVSGEGTAMLAPTYGKTGQKVALLLPLSGRAGPVGQQMLNAAQMAVFDIAGDNFELMPLDTKGTPAGARAAARKAVNDGAALVLGPLFGTSAGAAAAIVRQAGVNMVSFSSDRKVAGNGVFIMGFLPRTQVTRVVGFARSNGSERFAALLPDNELGKRVANAFQDSVRAAGGQVVKLSFYPSQGSYGSAVKDFASYAGPQAVVQPAVANGAAPAAQPAAATGAQAVLLADRGERMRQIADSLPKAGLNPGSVQMMGTMLWQNEPELGKVAALNNAIFAAAPPQSLNRFEALYKKAYGSNPLSIAALAYDGAALAAALSRDGGQYTIQNLTNPDGFRGVNGIFRFQANGLTQRGLALLKLTPTGFAIVEPGPTTFQAF